MKRLMVALSAVTVAALLLWVPEAASYDESAGGTGKMDCEPRCLRVLIDLGPSCLRTIEVTIALGGSTPAPRPTSWVGNALAEGDDLLWRTAAAIRRRALERLSDLLLRRKAH